MDEEEDQVRGIILQAVRDCRAHLQQLWPTMSVGADRTAPFTPTTEPFPTVEVLDAYEEEVRKMLYSQEVYGAIKENPVRVHLAKMCKVRSHKGGSVNMANEKVGV
eukprot:8197382-Pyramimonas_sp.AAC.1